MANVPSVPSVPATSVAQRGSLPNSSPPRAASPPNLAPAASFKSHLQRSLRKAQLSPSAHSFQLSAPRRAGAEPGSGVAVGSDVEGKVTRPGPDSEGSIDDKRAGASSGNDLLDPLTRLLLGDGPQHLAFERSGAHAPSAPTSPSAPETDSVALASRVSLEHVMSRFVRKVAWSGDANRGTARLELGAGALAGATLTIHSEQGAVSVSLELPPGVDANAWRERIARRLGARGLQVAELEVS